MTVAELIEHLQTLDQNAMVVHRGNKGGYETLEKPTEICVHPLIAINIFEDMYGIIGEWTEYTSYKYDTKKPMNVVLV